MNGTAVTVPNKSFSLPFLRYSWFFFLHSLIINHTPWFFCSLWWTYSMPHVHSASPTTRRHLQKLKEMSRAASHPSHWVKHVQIKLTLHKEFLWRMAFQKNLSYSIFCSAYYLVSFCIRFALKLLAKILTRKSENSASYKCSPWNSEEIKEQVQENQGTKGQMVSVLTA